MRSIKNLLPVLIIIILALIFFGQASIGKTLIVSGDFSGSDLLDLHLPFKIALSNSLRAGQLPLWNPYLSNGFPLFAEGQTGILYPINLALAFLPPVLNLNYSIIISFILAGLFSYLYCRSLGFSRFASLSSGIIFMFSAFFVTRLKHLNLITVAAWTPFVFYATHKLFQNRKFIYSLLAGLGLGLQFLAGHPQMAFYSLFIFLIYYLFETALASRKQGITRFFPYALVCLALIALVTVGISAVQTLPTLELTQQSERTEYDFRVATDYPFNPKNLIGFISPYFFGNPANGTYREDLQTMGVFWENASYIGLLPIILLPWVIYTIVRKKRQPYLIFFLFLSVFSLLLMLGKFTPVFGLIWSSVPGFSLFRFPTRFNLFLIFSLALLTGVGVEMLLSRLQKNYQEVTPADNANQPEFRLSWPLDSLKTQALILVFLVVDLFVFGKNYLGTLETKSFLQKPKSVEFLEKDSSLYRIWNVSQYMDNPYQLIGWKTNTVPLLAIHEAIPPNNNLIYNLASFSDRGWFEGGLSFQRRNMLERYLTEQAQDPYKLGQLLGMANVKYILNFSEINNTEIPLVKEINLGKDFGLTLKIYENKQVLPRAYFVPEAKVIKEEKAMFNELTTGNFYPLKTVLLENQPPKPLPPFTGAVDSFAKNNSVIINQYTSQNIIVTTDIKNDGVLVLSDSYYPGWKATIDGKKTEILRANYLFRAVELSPGKHVVRFYYEPLYFKIGAIISGLTVIAVLIFLVIYFLKAKPRKSQSNNT